ncbi:MAG TPA: fumarylacetoacetate hydrolase family protein [Bryobacteraceae bacterium]|nr:fumarylacetoacetate hydrolase family protein [Bryobacteraceae bacterium]
MFDKGIEQLTLSALELSALGERLYADERSYRMGRPFSEDYPDMTVADAYAIQLAYIERRVAAGARVCGHKVGCTNPVVQQLFNIHQPDYGQILDDMVLPDAAEIPLKELIQPRIEAEIGFILKRPLYGPRVTATQVLLATAGVVPCFEIIDSRIENWRIKFVDTVADNGSSARCVLGDRVTPADTVDLRLVGAVLERNGTVIATGAGAATLGHPAAAVAWLANALALRGQFLEEGHIVLSGAVTNAIQVQGGEFFQASFAGMGTVRCRFT